MTIIRQQGELNRGAMFDHQRIFCWFLLVCISSKVSVKTEFLPQFEETVRSNITVQELWTKIFSLLALTRTVISQTEHKKINSPAGCRSNSQSRYSRVEVGGINWNKMSGVEVLSLQPALQRLPYWNRALIRKMVNFSIEVTNWPLDHCWVRLYRSIVTKYNWSTE